MKNSDYLTYGQWRKLGYSVRKGEKSIKKTDDGKQALFSYKQVVCINYPSYNDCYNEEEDDYQITDYELCTGEHGD